MDSSQKQYFTDLATELNAYPIQVKCFIQLVKKHATTKGKKARYADAFPSVLEFFMTFQRAHVLTTFNSNIKGISPSTVISNHFNSFKIEGGDTVKSIDQYGPTYFAWMAADLTRRHDLERFLDDARKAGARIPPLPDDVTPDFDFLDADEVLATIKELRSEEDAERNFDLGKVAFGNTADQTLKKFENLGEEILRRIASISHVSSRKITIGATIFAVLGIAILSATFALNASTRSSLDRQTRASKALLNEVFDPVADNRTLSASAQIERLGLEQTRRSYQTDRSAKIAAQLGLLNLFSNEIVAVSEAKRALSYDTDKPESWFRLGLIQLTTGDSENAKKSFEKMRSSFEKVGDTNLKDITNYLWIFDPTLPSPETLSTSDMDELWGALLAIEDVDLRFQTILLVTIRFENTFENSNFGERVDLITNSCGSGLGRDQQAVPRSQLNLCFLTLSLSSAVFDDQPSHTELINRSIDGAERDGQPILAIYGELFHASFLLNNFPENWSEAMTYLDRAIARSEDVGSDFILFNVLSERAIAANRYKQDPWSALQDARRAKKIADRNNSLWDLKCDSWYLLSALEINYGDAYLAANLLSEMLETCPASTPAEKITRASIISAYISALVETGEKSDRLRVMIEEGVSILESHFSKFEVSPAEYLADNTEESDWPDGAFQQYRLKWEEMLVLEQVSGFIATWSVSEIRRKRLSSVVKAITENFEEQLMPVLRIEFEEYSLSTARHFLLSKSDGETLQLKSDFLAYYRRIFEDIILLRGQYPDALTEYEFYRLNITNTKVEDLFGDPSAARKSFSSAFHYVDQVWDRYEKRDREFEILDCEVNKPGLFCFPSSQVISDSRFPSDVELFVSENDLSKYCPTYGDAPVVLKCLVWSMVSYEDKKPYGKSALNAHSIMLLVKAFQVYVASWGAEANKEIIEQLDNDAFYWARKVIQHVDGTESSSRYRGKWLHLNALLIAMESERNDGDILSSIKYIEEFEKYCPLAFTNCDFVKDWKLNIGSTDFTVPLELAK